ncbi:hypothetical protein SO802_010088 [Lithocarpus litseifolius]|uniref:BED-type domain-containing protein n=1 Tax=Lithocarpus litseifolius TaxID=425828 RepID=A0AAW2DIW5_9ROSI
MSVTEGTDEFEQTNSSASKRSRGRTSRVWNDFEILPVYEDGHRKVKCRKCTNILTADKENETSNLHRHARRCHQENDSGRYPPPLDQDMYREKIAMAIIKHNYSFSFAKHEINREIHILLNPDVKPISKNTAKSNVLKINKRKKKSQMCFRVNPESSLPCSGEFFRVRCGAHILNLIVQEGLKIIEQVVHNIRESVKYVRGNDKLRFAKCLQKLPNLTSKKVRQDVPTRWNLTYLMIETALTFWDAFHNLSIVDRSFRTCPSDDEWDKA